MSSGLPAKPEVLHASVKKERCLGLYDSNSYTAGRDISLKAQIHSVNSNRR